MLSPLSSILRPSAYETSYLDAFLILLIATLQWLIVGRSCEHHMNLRYPAAHQWLSRSTPILIAALIVVILVLAPIVNEHSRAEGFQHGGISFR